MTIPIFLTWCCRRLLSLITWLSLGCQAFKHQNCTRTRSSQFLFCDCFLPAMNPDLFLSQASFLMSHDAATGYLQSNRGVSGATNLYAKNQIGTVYQQLNDGARALDVRPKLLKNGTIVCHHGVVTIPVTLQTLVQDAIRWVNENPNELVLILHLNLAFESGFNWEEGTAVDALSQVYNSLGVPYVACEDVYQMTIAQTMELAQLASGGYLLAIDRHDTYASSCAKLNYLSDKIVTCYPSYNQSIPCTKPNSPAFDNLKSYVLASANNDATDDNSKLGPPKSWDYFPFNAIQGLWQVDTHAATTGVAHLSSIIDDNTKSQLNARLVDWVYNGEFDSVSLLMVDHVQLNGNALLSVLRNTCGQSELEDTCGQALAKPKLQQKHMSTLSFFVTWSIYLLFGVWLACMIRHYRRYYHHDEEVARLKRDIKSVDESFQRVMNGEFI